MKQIKTPYLDSRLNQYCIFCGSTEYETRDHVPSKVLLDKPYPPNLPVIPACKKCNNNFSKDEDYATCVIECAKQGTTVIDDLQREKVKKILRRSPRLHKKIELQYDAHSGSFKEEKVRIENFLLKQALGHIAYEMAEFQLSDPKYIHYAPIANFSQPEIDAFLSPPPRRKISEIGSRDFMKGISETYYWERVQEEQYLYLVFCNGDVGVRIIISNYLFCEIQW